jgi:probable phosphoglycerate mutase
VTELILVRHGETDWNRERRWQGHAYTSLNETGREQARALAAELSAAGVEAVYSSDLARARETAEIVAERIGADVTPLAELREIDVGEWQGLTWPEIEERHPGGIELMHERGHGWERGETHDQLAERVLRGLRRIARDHPDGRVAVVAHGGTLRAVVAHAEGVSVVEHRRLRPSMDNCAVVRIALQNGVFRRID